MDAPTRVRFAKKYELWKQRLLDLGQRNRLLNFRPVKIANLAIGSPDSTTLYEQLVHRERRLSFPLYQGVEQSTEPDAPPAYRVVPGDLTSPKPPPDLEKSLDRLATVARTSREEMGINTLYVALGLLEWRATGNSTVVSKAPLILVPVTLEREDRFSPYMLEAFDEDPELNPTLVFMLQHDFNLTLPDFDPDELHDVEQYLDAVERKVRAKEWPVTPDIWLGQFQFRKLAMYRDLDDHREVAAANERVVAIAGFGGFGDIPDVPEQHEFDDLPASEVFTVSDADSSQLEVLIRARAGQDLVVQGPPGTGKSQTITNLIAQMLMDGKKVLFVSEKMAALSVVFARLQACGLGDLCLEVHSDKANKREVISRIARASQLEPGGNPRRLERDFDELMELRVALNDYVVALHNRGESDVSAFDLHGQLAQLPDAPVVRANLGIDVVGAADRDREALMQSVRRLAQMQEMVRDVSSHPFYGCALPNWSLAVQSEVADRFAQLADVIALARTQAVQLSTALATSPPETLADVRAVVEVAEIVSSSPSPPNEWLADGDLGMLAERAHALAENQRAYRDARAHLASLYSDLVLDIDVDEVRRSLDETETPLIRLVPAGGSRVDYVEQNLGELLGVLGGLRESLAETVERSSLLATSFGLDVPSSLSDCSRVASIAKAAAGIHATRAWFEPDRIPQLMTQLRSTQQRAGRLRNLEQKLGATFTEAFFDLPLREWQVDFTERYAGFLRVLSSGYRRSMREIRGCLASDQKLSRESILEALAMGAEVVELREWFGNTAEELRDSFGPNYTGIASDWSSLRSALDRAAEIVQQCNASVPDSLSAILRNGVAPESKLPVQGNELAAEMEAIAGQLESLGRLIAPPRRTVRTKGQGAEIRDLTAEVDALLGQAEGVDASLRTVRAHLLNGVDRSASDMVSDLESVALVRRQTSALETASADLESDYGHWFDGIDTDWQQVLDALAWTREFRTVVEKYQLGEPSLGAAIDMGSVESTRSNLPILAETLRHLEAGLEYLRAAFPQLLIEGHGVETATMKEVEDWLRTRVDRAGELRDWMRFRELREECETKGIGEFVELALQRGLSPESLEAALRRLVCTIRLDAVYAAEPVLRQFQWRDHEEVIRRFRELDTELMRAYARLVRARVIDRQPNLLGPAVGQLGFLRRELAKQRRHAPLRKLFQQAGSIIQDLMPCMLMSPLSVATFLPRDAMNFDIVIFDEASQMPAEEAIGPILRGDQLVVAGDAKQLPPTRFFEKMLDDEGDDEDDDIEILESVLEDCAAAGMKNCPLNWHYRSRHESLIAFSNAEFYENRLVTFPSPVEPPPPGMGVRLEYVEDGVYDRGKSRTNRDEARRVAMLVERHLVRYGASRSLGIIAMSSAQEDAIREALDAIILSRPELEPLLRSREGEPLFIKPLESVQGDERDSIIISIGYGPDSAGKLSLNFGPINSQGGERRLNVAVTRARWDLTIVSSLRARDIDEASVSSEGPKVLKRYLQFAEEGRLPPETVAPLEDTESPFEQSVYEALRDAGLQVDRQVGVSRYRIDLAVRDTRYSGRYLLGIECDGATYHRAAVARDRDRLRQQVLERLGWKIHRVWSTDWARAQRSCLQRILDRVAELQSVDDDPDDPHGATPARPPDNPTDPSGASPILPSPEPVVLAFNDDYDPYDGHESVSTISETPRRGRLSRQDFYDADTSDIRQEVVRVVQHEGPIHEDAVIFRVARMFDLGRAGTTIESMIRDEVTRALRAQSLTRRNRFLWPAGVDEVRPRRPDPGLPTRPIDQVPPEELESALALVLQLAGGVRPEELIPEGARVLGYQRTGANIERAFTAALKRMRKAGRIETRGDFLHLAPAVGQPTGDTGSASASEAAPRDDKPGRAGTGGRGPQMGTARAAAARGVRARAEAIAGLYGLKLIDKTGSGGALWIMAGAELRQSLRPLGFKWAPHGSKASGGKPGWYFESKLLERGR